MSYPAAGQEAASRTQSRNAAPLSLLVRASVGQVSVGAFDGKLDVVRAGMGLGLGKFGFVLSTGVAEVAPSGWSGDYMFQLTTVPIEGDITYGLVPGHRRSQPVFYLHGSYNRNGVLYKLHGGSVSVGAKWTFWAVSGGVQTGWRRSVFGEDPSGHRYADFYSVGITLDLGGWWPVDISPAGWRTNQSSL